MEEEEKEKEEKLERREWRLYMQVNKVFCHLGHSNNNPLPSYLAPLF